MLKKVTKYISEENERVWVPRGLYITNPIERGLRVVSPSPFQTQSSQVDLVLLADYYDFPIYWQVMQFSFSSSNFTIEVNFFCLGYCK